MARADLSREDRPRQCADAISNAGQGLMPRQATTAAKRPGAGRPPSARRAWIDATRPARLRPAVAIGDFVATPRSPANQRPVQSVPSQAQPARSGAPLTDRWACRSQVVERLADGPHKPCRSAVRGILLLRDRAIVPAPFRQYRIALSVDNLRATHDLLHAPTAATRRPGRPLTATIRCRCAEGALTCPPTRSSPPRAQPPRLETLRSWSHPKGATAGSPESER